MRSSTPRALTFYKSDDTAGHIKHGVTAVQLNWSGPFWAQSLPEFSKAVFFVGRLRSGLPVVSVSPCREGSTLRLPTRTTPPSCGGPERALTVYTPFRFQPTWPPPPPPPQQKKQKPKQTNKKQQQQKTEKKKKKKKKKEKKNGRQLGRWASVAGRV